MHLGQSDHAVIKLALCEFAAEPRPWTTRSLIDAVAKAGGWERNWVAAHLFGFGADGVAEAYGVRR